MIANKPPGGAQVATVGLWTTLWETHIQILQKVPPHLGLAPVFVRDEAEVRSLPGRV